MPFKYYGGVHPDYAKTASKTPVRTISPPSVVVLPMIQQIGAPNKPIVKVGDTVKMGQLIGSNDAPVSAPVHASVSGKVIAVESEPAYTYLVDDDGNPVKTEVPYNYAVSVTVELEGNLTEKGLYVGGRLYGVGANFTMHFGKSTVYASVSGVSSVER